MKKVLALLLAVVMSVALFGCSKNLDEQIEPTDDVTITEPAKSLPTYNPLTGESDFNEDAVGKRPMAIVVENLTPARPQWGIETPDIICEGEVEGGISRMLWLYADVNDVPGKVGPLRSARPSYVAFSTFFDAIFIHWGGSHSKAGYTGGYETIERLGVDDIDGMGGGYLFGRDKTRSTSVEHRGIMDGNKLSQKIADLGYRTELSEGSMTKLEFNDNIEDAGEIVANTVNVTFSSRTDTRAFKYSDDNLYHTNDWKTDVKFQNLVILMADSEYITVPYKGSKTTYLNYYWTSGKGYYVSNGKATNITWETSDGNLNLKDENGLPVSLNKGKSYIGFASANNQGKVTMA